MKATELLNWICRESISGEHLGIVDVPEEGYGEWEQNEGWWNEYFGGCPPYPVPEGRYLYYYTSQVSDYITPDAEIEFADDSIYLHRIED